MRKKRMYGCLVSCGVAFGLLALLWLAMSVEASPADRPRPERSVNLLSEISSLQGYTATIYLPLVMNGYPPCEPSPLNWASDPDGVLLRWRWPEGCAGPATFRVYRTSPGGVPVLLADSVAPVTDPAQAEALLGDDWPAIQGNLGITTTDELHSIRTENVLQAAYLANLYHRVALVYGWGYSDTTAAAGTVYTYSVEALPQSGGDTVAIGEVVAQAGDITPFSAPTGLTATQVISENLVGELDWVEAQKNRKADRRIYLRWDVAQSDPTTATLRAAAADLTSPWLVGYDIYRSESPTGPFTLLNDQPVLPMPTARPSSDPLDLPYELYDYFFQDNDPSLVYSHTYYYRVAPRDLLGRPRDWNDPDHRGQFSDYVAAVPRDTLPPPVPQNLTAAPLHLDHEIVLTWTAQTTDTVGYHLYWSWHPTASLLVSDCADPETCWVILSDIPDPATSVYTHSGIAGPLQQDKPYWYRIRAVDAAGNLSAPSEPVHAVLHDRSAPSKPSILYSEYLFVDGPPDAVEVFIYCSVDDGPYRLWKILEPDASGDAVYELYNEYKPPVPTSLLCRAQVVDANGNRSEFSDPTASIRLGPPAAKDPPAPVITVISTTGSADKGWTAVVNWGAEPTPGVKGFRLYREQVHPAGSRVMLADESTLARDTRVFSDTTVEQGKVYSYTVAIYRVAGFYGSELELPSRPYFYEVVPPLGERERQIVEIPWQTHYFSSAIGTYLSWYINDECHRSILFRSMERDSGYVQLTPPIGTTYTDSDAEHENYWYVALWLDCTSGEVIGRTAPWSAGATGATGATTTRRQSPAPDTVAIPAYRLRPLGPALAASLPPTLTLGWETEAEPFTIRHISYTLGSTLTNLSGSGVMTLGGGGIPPFTRTVSFSNLGAAADGRVLTGTLIHLLNEQFTYPGGMVYTITNMILDRHAGVGQVTLPLPAYTQVGGSGWGSLYDSLYLPDATLHPDLTFERLQTGLSADPCSVVTPTFYFEMNPLPLRIVPVSTVSYTHDGIFFEDGVCTQYEERYAGTRPPYPDPDASDQLLRETYQASGGQVWIGANGLEGKLEGTLSFKWSIAVPYDLRLQGTDVWLQFDDNQIVDGRISDGSAYQTYYSKPPGYFGFDWSDPPDSRVTAKFDTLYVGRGGSLYGEVHRIVTPVEWDGYRLDDITYILYVPPIETQKMPWEEAIGHSQEAEERFGLDKEVESGFNRIGDADFTWLNCGSDITFTHGVSADVYLRRGGVSGYLTATIPPNGEIEASLYGYDVYLTRFRLAFFDNELFDKDIVGDLSLPAPADIKLPLRDFYINVDGCVENARIREGTEPLLGLWRLQTHPTAVEFRPDVSPKFPEGMALWVLGRVEIPHLALPTDDGSPPDYESGLPLDMSLTPAGEFHAFEWKEESGRYLFDGFDLLIEEIGLSESGQQPTWVVGATLGDPPCTPPACSRGFITVTGHLLTPLFGELERDDARPELQFMTESDFVGFTARPHVRRGWTDKVGFGFEFDLLYAHDADGHAGRFLAWDQERFVNAAGFLEMFTLDWATAISPTETGIYFGLSTVPALVRTLADTVLATTPVTFTAELSQTARNEWLPALGVTAVLTGGEVQGYLDFTASLWEKATDPQKVTEEIDKLKDEDIPTSPKGGATIGKLADWGVHFDKVRGQAAFTPIYSGDDLVDYHLEELRVSLQMNIEWGTSSREVVMQSLTSPTRAGVPSLASPPRAGAPPLASPTRAGAPPLASPTRAGAPSLASPTRAGGTEGGDGGSFIRAKRITFQITRDGDYAIVGKGVRSNLSEYLDREIDFALLLNVTDRPRLEGGLIIYDLDFEAVEFERIGGVFGIGDAFFYLGGLGDATYQGNSVGGAFLFGTIYADSIVLREMGFGDLLDRLGDAGGGDLLVGGYMRVYGDFPIYNVGCLFRVNVGGEVAAWYFAAMHGDDNAWGGRLRGYVFGKFLCVVSARGDLTLEIFHPGHPDGTKSYAFRGQFWVAGGLDLRGGRRG